MTVTVSISDTFDGGNVKYVNQRVDPNNNDILDVILHIQPDVYTELEQIAHMQYFCFRSTVHGIAAESSGVTIRYILANAEKVSYPEAWPGTTICYSTNINDVDSWKRNLDTTYTDGKLMWEHPHTATTNVVYFTYFPPFSYARHLDLIAQCCHAASATTTTRNNSRCGDYYNCQVFSLGQTIKGREMDCIRIGTGSTVAWIIHRQHPGETMAEHYAEGLLTRLLGLNRQRNDDDDDDNNSNNDETVDRVLSLFTLYIVPCMCPDGAVLGHLRTNSVGANLNREWATKGDYEAPTATRSPEVLYVLQKMDETGVDIFLDIHGDEELPYNFLSGANHIPKWDTRMERLHGAFCSSYTRTNPDMQQRIGYPPPDSPHEVLLYMNVATNQVADRFDCLGLTLEMPFKDCRSTPDPEIGWSPARSRKLGASVLEPLVYIQPYLRADGDFWKHFPPEDAYVPTTDDYLNEDGQRRDGEFIMLHKRFYSDVHEIHKPPA